MRKGMTLVEMIMAVALLAVLGGVVLQMFLFAQGKNRDAWDEDQAVNRSVGIIETMKTLPVDADVGALELAAMFPDSEISVSRGTWELVFWYDDAWIPTHDAVSRAYRLTVHVVPDPDSNGLTGLLTLNAERVMALKGTMLQPMDLLQLSAGISSVPEGGAG